MFLYYRLVIEICYHLIEIIIPEVCEILVGPVQCHFIFIAVCLLKVFKSAFNLLHIFKSLLFILFHQGIDLLHHIFELLHPNYNADEVNN